VGRRLGRFPQRMWGEQAGSGRLARHAQQGIAADPRPTSRLHMAPCFIGLSLAERYGGLLCCVRSTARNAPRSNSHAIVCSVIAFGRNGQCLHPFPLLHYKLRPCPSTPLYACLHFSAQHFNISSSAVIPLSNATSTPVVPEPNFTATMSLKNGEFYAPSHSTRLLATTCPDCPFPNPNSES
jgi:hypothetical protein